MAEFEPVDNSIVDKLKVNNSNKKKNAFPDFKQTQVLTDKYMDFHGLYDENGDYFSISDMNKQNKRFESKVASLKNKLARIEREKKKLKLRKNFLKTQ